MNHEHRHQVSQPRVDNNCIYIILPEGIYISTISRLDGLKHIPRVWYKDINTPNMFNITILGPHINFEIHPNGHRLNLRRGSGEEESTKQKDQK
jgi:hypothetical protein